MLHYCANCRGQYVRGYKLKLLDKASLNRTVFIFEIRQHIKIYVEKSPRRVEFRALFKNNVW